MSDFRKNPTAALSYDHKEACRQLERPRIVYVLNSPAVEGVFTPDIHSSCVCNEAEALKVRMLSWVSPPTEFGMSRLARVFRGDFRFRARIVPWSLESTAARYSGRLGKRYQEALVSLRTEGLSRYSDSRIVGFIKAEKVKLGPKPSKPRMIWPRSPRYNLELASYLHPVEKFLWQRIKTPGDAGVKATRMVGKGLNSFERARLVHEKMSGIPNCQVVEIDASAFEAHLDVEHLKLEHSVYLALCPSDRLRQLLSWQLYNSGRTAGGLRFSRRGGRASGDYNTGLGNTLIMLGMCIAAMRDLVRGTKWDLLADGDNCLLFYEARVSEELLGALPAKFKQFGQDVKVEEPTSVLERVTFGQSRPVCVDGVYRMVRDPFKVLSTMAVGYRHFSELKGGLRVMKSIAQCELALGTGVPVIQNYAAGLLRDLENVKWASQKVSYEDYRYEEVVKDVDWREKRETHVSTSTRESFHLAWGVSPEEQVELEGLAVRLPRAWTGPIDGFPEGRFPGLMGRGPSERTC